MEKDIYKIANRCPQFDSIRFARGNEDVFLETRAVAPRCDHCAHWMGGSCDLFLAR